MQRATRHRRAGHTLPEAILVLLIVGLSSIVALRQLQLHLDHVAAKSAIIEAAGVIARARGEALAQRTPVAVRVDSVSGTLRLEAHGERLVTVALGHAYGVTLESSRDSIAYDVRGLGFGAANLTLVARRNAAAETLTVSRAGRVRLP